ncbi:MAG: transketolase [Planctomycetes bacterium]|nr:transketolase [Planctomycetota bacterium]
MNDFSKFAMIATKIRQDIVRMTTIAQSGHPGGSLSATDILTVLFFNFLNHKPEDPKWEARDRMIYSKGHVTPLIYSILARSGYFDPKELSTFRQLHSRLQGHPSKKDGLPGIESSGGSLGQNLSVAVGIALGLRERVRHKFQESTYVPKVYAICGDGELQEGNIWEGVMAAAHYKLDNLIAFVDKNNLQIDGRTKDVMNVDPIPEKFTAFNWHVLEMDGHDFADIIKTLEKTKQLRDKPIAIIAHTVKGKGVSFMEDKAGWHGRPPSLELAMTALRELGAEETLDIDSQQFQPITLTNGR